MYTPIPFAKHGASCARLRLIGRRPVQLYSSTNREPVDFRGKIRSSLWMRMVSAWSGLRNCVSCRRSDTSLGPPLANERVPRAPGHWIACRRKPPFDELWLDAGDRGGHRCVKSGLVGDLPGMSWVREILVDPTCGVGLGA